MRKITPRSNNGSLLIRFTYLGNRYNFNPVPGGRFDDKLAHSKACEVASKIQQDCIMGNFDPTLQRYKPQLNISTVESDSKPSAINQASGGINLLSLFEEFTKLKSKTLKENSLVTDYRSVRNKLNRCPHKYAHDAKKIVEWLINDCDGATYSSVKKHWGLINACCKWAVSHDDLQENPFEKTRGMLTPLKKHIKKNTAKPFAPEERDLVIAAFKKHKIYWRYAPLVEFLFFTGCRPSEAIALQWKHFKGSIVTVCQKMTANGNIEKGTKTEEFRTFPLNEHAMAAISVLKTDAVSLNDFVFKTKNGCLIDWDYFSNKVWRKVLNSLSEVEYRHAYQMRHTAITRMVKNGGNTAVIARHVGNSPKMIAERYLGDVSDVEMKSV